MVKPYFAFYFTVSPLHNQGQQVAEELKKDSKFFKLCAFRCKCFKKSSHERFETPSSLRCKHNYYNLFYRPTRKVSSFSEITAYHLWSKSSSEQQYCATNGARFKKPAELFLFVNIDKADKRSETTFHVNYDCKSCLVPINLFVNPRTSRQEFYSRQEIVDLSAPNLWFRIISEVQQRLKAAAT